MSECIHTDRIKTVLVKETDGAPHFSRRFLDFASYYGFIPRVCCPHRPETKDQQTEFRDSNKP